MKSNCAHILYATWGVKYKQGQYYTPPPKKKESNILHVKGQNYGCNCMRAGGLTSHHVLSPISMYVLARI